MLNFLTNAVKFSSMGKPVHVICTVLQLQVNTSSQRESSGQRSSSYGHISNSLFSQEVIPANSMFIKFQLEVRDQGIGIAADKVDKIFVEFSKLEDPSLLNTEGTGLGLSIAKSITEHMNGDMSVSSEVGQGTRFCITMRTKIQLKELQLSLGENYSHRSSSISSKISMNQSHSSLGHLEECFEQVASLY